MFKKVLGLVVGTMLTMSMVAPVQACDNLEVKLLNISKIEYNQSPERQDVYNDDYLNYGDTIHFGDYKVKGDYKVIDFAEDVFVGDRCAVVIDNKGTIDVSDDVVLDWFRY